MIINWKPAKNQNTPIYLQICNYFKQQIDLGYLVAEELLPSQRELAKIFQVNRSTIAKTMDELKFQGVIYTKGKGGTRIKGNTWLNFPNQATNLTNLLRTGLFKRKNELFNQIEQHAALIKYDFGKGELDQSLYPKEKMQEIMQKVISELDELPYGSAQGDEKLINCLKVKLTKMGIDLEDNDLLIVSGATQGLFLICLGLLGNDCLIKTTIPCYIKSLEIFMAAGLEISDLHLDKRGFNEVYYMIPTFHNPTGLSMSYAEKEKFMQTIGANKPIIEDDVFAELWFNQEQPKPLKAFKNQENVIYISSVSKTLAAGLRVGWICASKEIIAKLTEIKTQIDNNTPIINQRIVAEWLSSKAYLENLQLIRSELNQRCNLLDQLLNQDFKQYFSWVKPQGGYYFYLTSQTKPALQIFNECLELGLIIHPGELYGEINSYNIRLSLANCSTEKIKEAMKVLLEVMEK